MDLDSSSKSGPSSMVPIAIGLLGVVIGAIALFMSISNGGSATKQINELSAKVDESSGKVTQAVQTLADLDGKVKLTSDNVAGLRNQAQGALEQLAAELGKQSQRLTTLEERGSKPAAKGGAAETTHVVAGQGGTHIIASGDTFGKLATKYGVSVPAITAANPGVDSSKLKIGQKINIPGSSRPAPSSAPAPATTP